MANFKTSSIKKRVIEIKTPIFKKASSGEPVKKLKYTPIKDKKKKKNV